MNRDLTSIVSSALAGAVRRRDDSTMPHLFFNVEDTRHILKNQAAYGLQLIVPDGAMIPEANDTIAAEALS